MQDLCSTLQIQPRKYVLDRAEYSAPTPQHGLDYTNQECLDCLVFSMPPVALPENKPFDAVIYYAQQYRSPPHKRFLVGRRSPFMRLAETPHGASCLVQAMSAWSVETRRAPSRHCRGARVYVHTATACLLYTSPSPRDKRQSRMPSSA